MSNWANANYGVVRSVSGNRNTIKIVMPRGGVFECRNEGFEIGQAVCFALDALNRRIIKVLPKEVADTQVMMGLHPELQIASQEQPTRKETNDGTPSVNSNRCSNEEYFDILSRMDREMPERRYNNNWPASQK